MRWQDLEEGAPELAATARAEFERTSMVLVGTLRRSGAPRISCVEPVILDGELYLGMMWRSRKAVDLLRDPRLVLHNAIATNLGNELELSLHGRVADVRDEELRERFNAACGGVWGARPFHLFRVELESAGLVRYAGGEQLVQVWPSGRESRRRY